MSDLVNVNNMNNFLKSDNLVYKIIFLFIALIVFILCIKFTINIISKYKHTDSPILINGMIDAKNQIVIPQNPSTNGAVTLARSNNQQNGIEFTWSVWIFIDNLQYLSGKIKNVFYKGYENQTSQTNAPGLYIAPDKNELIVLMNTFTSINDEIKIPNIPLNKWVNVIIRCENNTLDVYINGTIIKSIELSSVPKQNFGDIFVAANGGFDGYISNLVYYDRALGTLEISDITYMGPNTVMIGYNSLQNASNKYLSTRWYFYGNQDAYNP
jgi:hypothetical protein